MTVINVPACTLIKGITLMWGIMRACKKARKEEVVISARTAVQVVSGEAEPGSALSLAEPSRWTHLCGQPLIAMPLLVFIKCPSQQLIQFQIMRGGKHAEAAAKLCRHPEV